MHHIMFPARCVPTLGPALLVLSLLVSPVAGAEGDDSRATGRPYNPTIAAASDEGERAIRTVRVPAGLKVELFAAEPLLANPVAFCIDEKGRFYVAETFRHESGVTDTRGHMNWLDDDLACRTVADRVAMYRKYLGKRVRVLQGRARAGAPGRRPRRRRQGRHRDRLRRRLQRPGRGHRRRPAGAQGRGLVRLHPLALEAPRHARRRHGRPSESCCTRATACTSASSATTCTG